MLALIWGRALMHQYGRMAYKQSLILYHIWCVSTWRDARGDACWWSSKRTDLNFLINVNNMWNWTWPWKSRLYRAKVDETQVAIECTLLVPSWVKLIRSFFVIIAFVGHSCRWSWRAAKGGQPEVSEANETIMKTLTVEWVRCFVGFFFPRSCLWHNWSIGGPAASLWCTSSASIIWGATEPPERNRATELQEIQEIQDQLCSKDEQLQSIMACVKKVIEKKTNTTFGCLTSRSISEFSTSFLFKAIRQTNGDAFRDPVLVRWIAQDRMLSLAAIANSDISCVSRISPLSFDCTW